jgi:hypothetical protein
LKPSLEDASFLEERAKNLKLQQQLAEFASEKILLQSSNRILTGAIYCCKNLKIAKNA